MPVQVPTITCRLIVPCLLKKKKYKCSWFYLTDNLETIHVQVWGSFIVRSVSSRICCSYKFFLSPVIFIFPLFQLHYTIPKNKRKIKITQDKKLTTTYKSNGKCKFLPHAFYLRELFWAVFICLFSILRNSQLESDVCWLCYR